jgi:nitrogen fixation protein FixH
MTEKGKLTGRHVLIMVLAFFGVMIAANVIFISAAVKSFPGVAEEKSYFQGLHYNDTLAERTAQSLLGWRAEVSEVTRDGAAGAIVVRMTNANGAALSGLVLTGALKRPTHSTEDQALAFDYLGDGAYRAEIKAFAAGAWDLTARAENSDGDAFDIDARIVAP